MPEGAETVSVCLDAALMTSCYRSLGTSRRAGRVMRTNRPNITDPPTQKNKISPQAIMRPITVSLKVTLGLARYVKLCRIPCGMQSKRVGDAMPGKKRQINQRYEVNVAMKAWDLAKAG